MTQEHTPLDFLYMPPRASMVTMKEVNRRMSSPYRLNWNISEIDARWIPPVPGEVISFMGRPGHAKTTTMIALARMWSVQVRKLKNKNGKEPLIVYATWETTVEEFMAVYTTKDSGQSLESIGRGTANVPSIERALVNTLGDNVVVLGRSSDSQRERGGTLRTRTPLPTILDIDYCLSHLKEQGFDIAAVFIDYLQRIRGNKPWRSIEERSSQVSEHTELLKDLAVTHDVAMVVGVQADRKVDRYDGLKFPLDSDAQFSSSVEQCTDKLMSLTRPSKYMDVGSSIVCNGWEYEVTPEMLAIQMRKQRFGPQDESDLWLLNCNFAHASLSTHPVKREHIPC